MWIYTTRHDPMPFCVNELLCRCDWGPDAHNPLTCDRYVTLNDTPWRDRPTVPNDQINCHTLIPLPTGDKSIAYFR
jgi:hypothetical protein